MFFCREGSVIIDFIVHLKEDKILKDAKSLSVTIKSVLYSESNTTTDFSRKFRLSLNSITVQASKSGQMLSMLD